MRKRWPFDSQAAWNGFYLACFLYLLLFIPVIWSIVRYCGWQGGWSETKDLSVRLYRVLWRRLVIKSKLDTTAPTHHILWAAFVNYTAESRLKKRILFSFRWMRAIIRTLFAATVDAIKVVYVSAVRLYAEAVVRQKAAKNNLPTSVPSHSGSAKIHEKMSNFAAEDSPPGASYDGDEDDNFHERTEATADVVNSNEQREPAESSEPAQNDRLSERVAGLDGESESEEEPSMEPQPSLLFHETSPALSESFPPMHSETSSTS